MGLCKSTPLTSIFQSTKYIHTKNEANTYEGTSLLRISSAHVKEKTTFKIYICVQFPRFACGRNSEHQMDATSTVFRARKNRSVICS